MAYTLHISYSYLAQILQRQSLPNLLCIIGFWAMSKHRRLFEERANAVRDRVFHALFDSDDECNTPQATVQKCVAASSVEPPGCVAPSSVESPAASSVEPPACVAPSPIEPPASSPAAEAPVAIDLTTDTTERPPVDDWAQYKVRVYPDGLWWTWGRGIIDLKTLWPTLRQNRSEGLLLDLACRKARWVLEKRDCKFKVGMTTNLGVRWRSYLEDIAFRPSHMFILHEVQGRVVAGYVEAAVIRELSGFAVIHNINSQRNDKGGTGQRAQQLLDAKYYIYLVVQPTRE